MKRMKHPNHGRMYAYNPNDEAYLRKLGWVEDDKKLKPVTETPPEVVEPEPEAKRGPGRPRKVITG
jgi:hypothetical protein